MRAHPQLRELLKDRQVVFSGRLASMSRRQAEELVADAGGEVAHAPTPRTAYLVIGQECGFADDGRLDDRLERARILEQNGAPIAVVTEDEFFARLDGGAGRLYTIAQLGRILGLPGRRIRAWVRAGLIRPARIDHRLLYFEFGQVAAAKVLSDLTEAGVAPARIRRTLEQIRTWLPHADDALGQLELLERGDVSDLVVRLDDGRFAEPSGQLQLDFGDHLDVGGVTPAVPEIADDHDRRDDDPPRARILPGRPTPRSAEAWFDHATWLEDTGQLGEAENAYRKALEVGDEDPETIFNLGNVLYGLGEKVEAIQSFLRAVQLDPSYVEAWNNLGNALTDLGRHDEAIEAFRVAVTVAPAYADAHYNLAETFAAAGRRQEAERHWRAYLLRDPHSRWAEEVRDRLRTGA